MIYSIYDLITVMIYSSRVVSDFGVEKFDNLTFTAFGVSS
jgi:hypothetical protein